MLQTAFSRADLIDSTFHLPRLRCSLGLSSQSSREGKVQEEQQEEEGQRDQQHERRDEVGRVRDSKPCVTLPITLICTNRLCREEKDDTLSAISIGSLKPEIASGQPATSHTITTPTLPGSSISGNAVPTATPEVDEDEYSKPAMDSWDKNGSPQKSEFRGSGT